MRTFRPMKKSFLAGFVSLILKKLFSYLPQCLKGIEASLFHPVLSTVIVLLVMIYLNGYLYIAHSYILQYVSLVESQMSTKILFGFFLGMMMAIDNGGPINKTAYVFGIGMLISYDYYPMAAVMAGGMIPPFVIALTANSFVISSDSRIGLSELSDLSSKNIAG